MTTLRLFHVFNKALIDNGFPRAVITTAVQTAIVCLVYQYHGWQGVWIAYVGFFTVSYLVGLITLMLYSRYRRKQVEAALLRGEDDPYVQALKRKVRDGLA